MRPSILRPAELFTGGLYHRIWKPPYHVALTKYIANHGCFHSRASLEAGKILNTSIENGISLNATSGWPNKAFMVTSSSPSVTRYQDILNHVAALMSSPNVRGGESSGIVILATSIFATWLENMDFMRTVLEMIFPHTPGPIRAPNSDVTVLMAVVDGLPSKRHNDICKISEGFAFLPCDPLIVLPDLWHDEETVAHGHSNHFRSGITVKLRSGADTGEGLDIGLPLANTVFQNGRISTLLASKWIRTNGADALERVKQVEKSSATIYPTKLDSNISLNLEIPLIPLTPPRLVVSGLGNILRQVANDNGQVVSASQELEASVNSYLETRLLNKQTVTVWALIIPDVIVTDRISGPNLISSPEEIRDSWADGLNSGIRSNVGNLIKNGSGATLHRVLSGGGGWGLKQGLLSLDPETSLLRSDNKEYDLTLSDDADNDQIHELGNIARPGSWVQFLISDTLPSEIPTIDAGPATVESEFKLASSLSFGCVASTADDIPQPSSDPSAPSDANTPKYSVNSSYGRFGAMSEAGIFICAMQNGVVTSSKVDVPNSDFHVDMSALEQR